ncbi:MAG: DUF6745 domain-containing protein [Heteroscytonema crispum UTEX LB 1556]
MLEIIFPEQEALIRVYREKWKQIALSTQRINKEEAAHAIHKAYAFIGITEPEIIFCDSRCEATKFIVLPSYERGNNLARELDKKILEQLQEELIERRDYRLGSYLGDIQGELEAELVWRMWFHLMQYTEIEKYMHEFWLKIEKWAAYGSCFDFVVSVLEYFHTPERWEVFESLMNNCGLIFPFEKVAIVCDRPTKVSFNNQSQLHGSNEPAIQFADGYSLIAYNGLVMPTDLVNSIPFLWVFLRMMLVSKRQ